MEAQLAEPRDRLAERQIQLDVAPDAPEQISEEGYDPVYSEIKPGGTIWVSVNGAGLAVDYVEPAVAA